MAARVELLSAESARAVAAAAEAKQAQSAADTTKPTDVAVDSAQANVALGTSTPNTEDTIKQVLTAQKEAWNAGDIDTFMETYWKSDDLTFSSGGKTTRSWQETLERSSSGIRRERPWAL